MKGNRLWILWLGLAVSVAGAKAEDPIVEEAKAKSKIVEAHLKNYGTTLHRVLTAFYSDAVGCYQSYPRQGRGYPRNFEACLDRVAAAMAVRFTEKTGEGRPEPYLRLRKLDRILRQKSEGARGVIDLALPLVRRQVDCLAATTETLRPCLLTAANAALDDLVAEAGEPGRGGQSDLAVVEREVPAFTYVARFNDYGKYYQMPHAAGLPPGQYRHPGLPRPVYPRIDYAVMIRNGFIGAMLFGKPAFGDYRKP